MTTYADSTRCPDCSAALGPSPRSCPMCGLPLTGPTAFELFAALTSADRALAALRDQKVGYVAPVSANPSGAFVGGAAPAGAGSPTEGLSAFPRDVTVPRAPRRGLSGASVPKVLLSLGALCLLVAAVTFLAVAWSWLGVGGRTVVIVTLTAVALGLTGLFHRRDLRVAAEALSVVALGLVSLDVVGARNAGWLGGLSDSRLGAIAAVTVAVVALVLLLVTRVRPLIATAVLVPLALLVAVASLRTETTSLVPVALVVVALVLLGRLGTWLPSHPLTLSALPAAALGWLWLVGDGLSETGTPYTVAHLWGDLAAWPLVAAVVTMALAAPVAGLGRSVRTATIGTAALLASYVVVLAALDNSATTATACLLVLTGAWTAAVAAGPSDLRRLAVVPLAGVVLLPVGALVASAGESARAVLGVGSPFSEGVGVRVLPVVTWVAPWLLVPSALVLGLAGCAVVALLVAVSRRTWVAVASAAMAAGAALTLPLYGVPLAVPVAVLVLTAVAALLLSERLHGHLADVARIVGAALMVLAVAAALPSDLMTAIVLLTATAATALLMVGTDGTPEIAAGSFPLALAGLVWSAAEVGAVPEVFRAAPVLVVLGLLALWRPQPVLEATAAVVGLVVSAAAVGSAQDHSWALAVHLTLAGTLVTAVSLAHPSRRLLAWPGGLLLAMATWVRLYDLGVHTPEAYTLPAALVLVGVAAWRLRDDGKSSTSMLTPGLVLATVPSLLVALGSPYSIRALLVGLACLALVLAGAAIRWQAPLEVGSTVGAVLVLRELAPYAATIPPWLLIALSGALLTAVGVTWESRMQDMRTARKYVAGLR